MKKKKKTFSVLIRESNLRKSIKIKLKRILSLTTIEESIYFISWRQVYNDSWKIIHSMHILKPKLQLQIFSKILLKFSNNKCSCEQDAHIIFMALLNENEKIFYHIKYFKDFWIYFHNIINLKLDKDVFIDN
jgi:hypothetical protein